jgi:hypothetical protein
MRVVVHSGLHDRGGEGGGFQHAAHEVHLVQLLGGEHRDPVARVGPVLDEPLPQQRLQRLAHRDGADAEHRRDLVERDGRARRHAAVEHAPPQLGEDDGLGTARLVADQPGDQH